MYENSVTFFYFKKIILFKIRLTSKYNSGTSIKSWIYFNLNIKLKKKFDNLQRFLQSLYNKKVLNDEKDFNNAIDVLDWCQNDWH